jgi:hypothetical protein
MENLARKSSPLKTKRRTSDSPVKLTFNRFSDISPLPDLVLLDEKTSANMTPVNN